MTMKRRTFLKGSLAAGTVGVAVSAGLLTPSTVMAAWPKSAFEAKSVEDALSATGMTGGAQSDDIKIKAPDIAENGAVVPITITASMAGVESIALLAAKNAVPLTSSYTLGKSAEGYVSTRIKMGKTSDVIAVVKAGGKVYTNKKEVKVTIGGCGG
ncbi:MAG: thiosulfate oxidation carrier protein SoxY [Gammaproteobacteria bacterium]|nr:MAG: thiosulfate oxidation carrier protein SoxY [Gammaproteobacteria bacterium]